jgi:outer membrane receptor for ferrienterochelin and colicin
MKMRHIAMAVAVALSSSYAMADTSSAIRGRISNPEGAAAAGTKVIILHVPSGTSRTVVTNETGNFVASGLRVGGPYKVIVDSETYSDETVNDVFLQLGDTYQLNKQLQQVETVERIAVTGSVIASSNVGASSSFNQEMIENSPAFNRDIKDIVRNNPLAVVSEDNQLSIGGANSKFNSFTVDGIGQNDDFGLNSSGYPSQRSPISLDAIEQISVDVSPFTAKVGGFSGGIVNVVTKSGGNDTKGSFFYEFTDENLAGDAEATKIGSTNKFSISEQRTFGATLGGAVVEDKLFYFVSVESFKQTTPMPFGVGSGTNPSRVSKADVDAVIKTLKDVYGITDSLGSDPVDTDDKILLKLDWNINEQHRADFTFQYQDNIEERNFTDSATTVRLKSNAYDYQTLTSNYAAHLFSDWTDSFSTEISLAYKDVVSDSILNAKTAAYSVRAQSGTISGGTDVFRHANYAANKNLKIGVDATYLLEEHTINFGAEVESLNLYNLFAESSLGSWSFDRSGSGATAQTALQNFQNKRPITTSTNPGFVYKNAPSNDIQDTAVDLTRVTQVLYVEDQFSPIDEVDVTAGLRYERLASDDLPAANPEFFKTYGYTNTENMDGLDVLLPRLGLTWYASDSLTVRGGVGRYGGGQPNVWVTNSYSNNGITFVEAPLSVRRTIVANQNLVDFTKVPQAAKDSLLEGGSTNYIDPNFKLPTDWRYQLGFDYNFDLPVVGDDITWSADATYVVRENAAAWVDTSRIPSGKTTVDGRIIYKSIRSGNQADFFDIALTNTDKDETSRILSTTLTKAWDSGVRATASYTNQDADESVSGTSSRAISNYGTNVVINRNEAIVAPSTNMIEHRLVLNMGYSTEFFAGYATKFDLFFERRSGRPFSYVLDSFNDAWLGDQSALSGNADIYLPYVPKGANDPAMKFGTGADGQPLSYEQVMAVFNAAGLTKYAGTYAPKNEFTQPWVTTMDLNIQQEIPAFAEGHSGTVYLTVMNLANLFDKDAGQVYRMQFPQQQLFNWDLDPLTGQYIYLRRQGDTTTGNNINTDITNFNAFAASASTWRIKVGVNYRF